MKTVVCDSFDAKGEQAFCFELNKTTGAMDTSESKTLQVYLSEGWKILELKDVKSFLGTGKNILLQR